MTRISNAGRPISAQSTIYKNQKTIIKYVTDIYDKKRAMRVLLEMLIGRVLGQSE